MNCDKCQDRKYILIQNKWKPCSCLIDARKLLKYNQSGVLPYFYEYTWIDFLKNYPNMKSISKICKVIISKIKTKSRLKFMYIQGDANSGKQALIALLFKEFINEGLSTKIISLNELIQMEFDKEEKYILSDIYCKYDVVCLRIGTIIEHSYARPIIEKFFNTRKNYNKYAIITSRLDIESKQGLYGIEVAKFLCDGRRVFKIRMK